MIDLKHTIGAATISEQVYANTLLCVDTVNSTNSVLKLKPAGSSDIPVFLTFEDGSGDGKQVSGVWLGAAIVGVLCDGNSTPITVGAQLIMGSAGHLVLSTPTAGDRVIGIALAAASVASARIPVLLMPQIYATT